MSLQVEIEYCKGCGYLPRFEELANLIKKNVPTAEVKGVEGRIGAFEVSVNNIQIYSKLSTMAFPDFDSVLNVVKDAAEGKDIKPLTDNSSWCNII